MGADLSGGGDLALAEGVLGGILPFRHLPCARARSCKMLISFAAKFMNCRLLCLAIKLLQKSRMRDQLYRCVGDLFCKDEIGTDTDFLGDFGRVTRELGSGNRANLLVARNSGDFVF